MTPRPADRPDSPRTTRSWDTPATAEDRRGAHPARPAPQPRPAEGTAHRAAEPPRGTDGADGTGAADTPAAPAAPAARAAGSPRPRTSPADTPTAPTAADHPPHAPGGAPDKAPPRTTTPTRTTHLRRALHPLRPPLADRANALHAGAWWLWALGLATAASRTTNPLLLALLVAVAGYVVAARRTDAPWARSYTLFLKLGLLVIVVRLLFATFLGSPIPGTHTFFTLPEVPLPEWAQGVRLGGRVTAEQLAFALYDGMKLAALLICVGAANALANPARLLKSLPAALYELGVAVVVAMTFAPHFVADVARLRRARRLRGRDDRGPRALLQVGLPVLEGALERSVALAAAMDARGYGRTARLPRAVRLTTAALTLGGLLGVCAGTYGLLASSGAEYGLPVLALGAAAAAGGLWLGGRRAVRSRYRPDRFGPRAWLVAASGAAVGGLMIYANSYAPAALHPTVVPLTAPELPLWPAAGCLLGLLPALVAPVPPRLPGPAGDRTRKETAR
jgi:energy-coupling factor transport system permease protein